MALVEEDIAKLYVASFNRAPDSAGLSYWLNDTIATTLEEISNAMFLSTEMTTLYPSTQTNTQFVESLYLNMFNRSADTDGLAYWVGQLDDATNAITREFMVQALINGAKALENDDSIYLNNKSEVAVYFAKNVLQGNKSTSELQLEATTVLTDVTKESSTIDTAKSSIDKIVSADAASLGTTYILTTSNEITTSTYKNDTLTAVVDVENKENNTYDLSDIILDPSNLDKDILTITSNGSILFTPTIAKIETININISSFSSVVVDVKDISDSTITIDMIEEFGSKNVNIQNINGLSNIKINLGELVEEVTFSLISGSPVLDASNANTVVIKGVDENEVTLVANKSSIINLSDVDGSSSFDDKINITTSGTVALDVEAFGIGFIVENLTLTGSGGLTTYDINDANTAANTIETITLKGSDDITLIMSSAAINAEVLTDSTTNASTKLVLDTALTSDLTLVTPDIIELSVDAAQSTYTLAPNQNFQISSSQTATTTLTSALATAATNTITLLIDDNDSSVSTINADTLTFTNFEDLNIVANDNFMFSSSVLFGATSDVFFSGEANITAGILGSEIAIQAESVDASSLTGDLTISLGTTINNIKGGTGNDTFIIEAGSQIIDGSDGLDTVSFEADADMSNSTLTFSNIEAMILEDDKSGTLKINSSMLDNKSYTITDSTVGDESILTVNLDGTIIDLSSLVIDDNEIAVILDLSSVNTLNTLILATVANDSLINTNIGAITIDGKAGNDVIVTGSGIDLIIGGEGSDTITSSANADVINLTETVAAIDTVITSIGTAFSPSDLDTIISFSAALASENGDNVDIDLSDIQFMSNINDLVLPSDASTIIPSDVGITTNVLAEYDMATTTAKWLNISGTFNSTSALETALEIGGSRALTTNGTYNAKDAFLVTYSDGIDAYLSVVSTAAGTANDSTFISSDLTVTNMLKFTGITDVTTFTNDSFDIIA